MAKNGLALLGAIALGFAAFGENLVKEDMREFDVPFKGEGKMGMKYIPVFFPKGTEGVVISFEAKITDVVRGSQSWFDARMMTDLIDSQCKKVATGPVIGGWKGTRDWFEVRKTVKVPAGAKGIALMPSLFNVRSGKFEIRNLSVVAQKKYEELPEEKAAREERERQAKARYVPDEPERREKWPKMLRVAGNRLVDPDGKEVWLQGVNAGGMETIPNGEQQVKSTVVAIDEWRANCIRLPITEAHWFGRGTYQSGEDAAERFRRDVDKIVRLAANRGAYVAIDLHRFRAPKAEHVEFWKDCAARYANHPAVLFDLFNEPHGISWEVWRNGGWVGEQGKRDESAFLSEAEKSKNQGFESVGMQALVDAVRSAGAKNVVIAGGLAWANDLTGIESEAIEKGEKASYRLEDKGGNGIMYSWHTYHWHTGWARLLPVAAKHPIFLGEVGAAPREEMTFIPLEQKEDPYKFSPNMLGLIQKYRINWTGWCFHPKAGPCMIENWDYKPTPYWGEFAKRALSGERFELTRMK